MNPSEYKNIKEFESSLKIGDPVTVFWGYGLGFRAEAQGVIEKIYPKSFRVKILHDVKSPQSDSIGWPAGFVLMGIPRLEFGVKTWDAANRVAPPEKLLDWRLSLETPRYFYWEATDRDGRAVYNCTKIFEPPTSQGGYRDLGALMRLKNDH